MVSSKFCRRSAMFLTVRNRLVSGSSPDQHNKKKQKKFKEHIFSMLNQKDYIFPLIADLKGPRWMSGWSW